MLAEERFSKILSIIEKEGSVNIQQLMAELDASESTVRRDLTTMAQKNQLIKVHGGAVSKNQSIRTNDEEVHQRRTLNTAEKIRIGKYAAELIRPDDFVYIDAGTTTEMIIQHIKVKKAVFVTNGITHARLLSNMGCTVYIIGGEFKAATEAIVGEEAVASLNKYNFTKGFWGTNGITVKNGFTTPEVKEAMVKRMSMLHCKEPFIVADPSKFSKISSIQFADFGQATVLTTKLQEDSYKKYKNIVEVDEYDLHSNF